MTTVVTGATGQLGRLVVEALLARGVPASEIVATGRKTARLADLAERGVRMRAVDYADVASLRAAFTDAEKVLLISSSEVGTREAQHRTVIEAAREAGVGLLAYTSIANADRIQMQLASEHRATERALAESGLPFVLLRNSWYLENYTAHLATYLEHGVVLGSAGDGRVSAATRADYAEAAAAVLASDVPAGSVFELGGDRAFTLSELAAAVGAAAGRPVSYTYLPEDELTNVLTSAGLDAGYAAVLADSDVGISRGELLVETGDLSQLIGRATVSMPEAVHIAALELRQAS